MRKTGDPVENSTVVELKPRRGRPARRSRLVRSDLGKFPLLPKLVTVDFSLFDLFSQITRQEIELLPSSSLRARNWREPRSSTRSSGPSGSDGNRVDRINVG